MLQNWPIRSKLVAILILPLVALAVFSALQVRADLESVDTSNRVRDLAAFSTKVNDLIDALQQERYASSAVVGSQFREGVEEMQARRGPTDTAVTIYQREATRLPKSVTEDLQQVMDTIRRQLDQVPDHRQAIDQRQTDRVKNTEFYNKSINDLLDLIAQVGVGTDNAKLINYVGALTSVSRAREAAAQQRGSISVILFHQTNVAVVKQAQANAGAEDAWIAQFRTTSSPEEQDFYDKTVDPVADNISQMRDAIVFAAQMNQPITIDSQRALESMADKISRIRLVENQIAADLTKESNAIASHATRNAWLSSLLVVLVLAVSVGISLLVASPMIRQLRRLRGAALEVANDSLPSVVERLHRGEQVQVETEVFPVRIGTKDEIGQVGEAFGTVHQVAVRTAVEQAAMRKSIGDTFLNLARRSQALIHRQLKVIDALERKETDPDELAELFRLDHLATRMRRHAEDLIVLSGSKPARGWRRPVAIKDVVRGAVAEVEDYTRVKVLPIAGSAIGGHAVGDVIHMLAELIENATSFSPPHTPVHVSGHQVSNGSVLEVEDRGLGMTDEEYAEINGRLSNPPPFDLRTSERLGLFVVSRLAQRHGIQVRLRPSPYGGTLAIVLVPTNLLREIDDAPQEEPTTSRPERTRTPALDAPLDVPLDAHLEDSIDFGDPTALTDSLAISRPLSLRDPIPMDDSDPLDDRLPLSDSLDTSELLSVSASPMPSATSGSGGGGEDRPFMDDLPVFPTIRSSWFVSESDQLGDGDTGTGADDSTGNEHPRERLRSNNLALEPNSWTEPPSDSPAPPPPLSARWDDAPSGPSGWPQPADPWADPLDAQRQRGLPNRRRSGPATEPFSGTGSGFPQASAAPAAPPGQPDETGLPKRQRRASLAPELKGTPTNAPVAPSLLTGTRSPDEIRSMMSSFQSNFGRGLQEGPNPNGDDDAKRVM
ncbi:MULTISPECIES: sensor histidine kinase [Protofrankia]|uniref:histidine kinase n=1 Tax=Candidatus Protofrankia datiscae TaxID=2716812 RepID=F8B675_9ACTN|nr:MULTISPECIES: ATP-binding protein [Protofrankia]AEH08045.1 Nitrate and nitrite sensing domain protein [Candidatus Protofrankia datiscae]